MLLVWILLLIIGLGVAWLFWSERRPPGHPPGPLNIPVIGQILSLDILSQHDTFNRWAEKYGPIYSVKIGSRKMVVLSDQQMIRDTFNKLEVANAPDTALNVLFNKGHYGLTGSNGELWKENRRFTQRHLREFGLGKSVMENVIRDEIVELMNFSYLANLGKPIDVGVGFTMAITNIVWGITAGFRMKHDDEKMIDFLSETPKTIQALGRINILDYFPWCRAFVPKKFVDIDGTLESEEGFNMDFLKPIVQDHWKNYQENDMRDYIDCYIRKQKEDMKNPLFFEWQLIASLSDLFSAGGETAATTLRWAFLLLCLHQDCQKKVQEEVDRVVGNSRMPQLTDRENLPYTEAFVSEVQRFADILPTGLPHRAEEDVTIGGYTVPKGTHILALLRRVHNDPKYFKNPEKFDPTHFLNNKGELQKNDSFMPFLTGKRMCLGDSLARQEMFLFVASFCQKFDMRLPEGHNVTSDEVVDGSFLIQCQKFKLIPTLRHQ